MKFKYAGNFRAPFRNIRFFSSTGRLREAVARSELEIVGSSSRLDFADALAVRQALSNEPTSQSVDYTTQEPEDRLRGIGGGEAGAQGTRSDSLDSLRLGNYVTAAKVTSKAGAHFADVTIELPYTIARRVIDSNLIPLQSVFTLEWGWRHRDGDITSGTHVFYVTGTPTPKIESTKVSIELKGVDALAGPLSASSSYAAKVFSRKSYPKDADILESITRDLNLSLKISPNIDLASPLFRVRKKDYMGRRDNWQTFKRLCRDNKVLFDLRGTEVEIFDQEAAKTIAPVCRIAMGQQLDNKTIPAVSIDPQFLASYFVSAEARALRLIQSQVEQAAGSIVFNQAANKLLFSTMSDPVAEHTGEVPDFVGIAGQATAISDGETRQSVKFGPELRRDEAVARYIAPIGDENAEQRARAYHQDSLNYANQRLTVECMEHPLIRAYDTVEVVVGFEAFSGIYQIIEITRNVTGPFSMSLVLQRSSLNIPTRESGQPLNVKKPSPVISRGITAREVTE